MKLEEVPPFRRREYIKECPTCQLEQKILTQQRNLQEYDTNIYLECQCEEYLEFILPVN